MKAQWIPLLALGACGGNGASTQGTDRAFTLVYSHDVEGEIEPCG